MEWDPGTGEVAPEPLEGEFVPCAAESFNACFERLLCLWIPKGICLMRNRGRSTRLKSGETLLGD